MLDAAICNKQYFEGLTARTNALFQAVRHGIGPDMTMLLSLSFAVGDEDESDNFESDEVKFTSGLMTCMRRIHKAFRHCC